MAETHDVRASLGCGTLILIAIIVMLFSGQQDHGELERKIEALTEEMKGLREEVGRLKAGKTAEADAQPSRNP